MRYPRASAFPLLLLFFATLCAPGVVPPARSQAPVSPPQYSLTIIPGPDGDESVATGLNNAGAVVGGYSPGPGMRPQPFTWEYGRARALWLPHLTNGKAVPFGDAFDISNGGMVVGAVGPAPAPYTFQGGYWTRGRWHSLYAGALPAQQPLAMDDFGDMVGRTCTIAPGNVAWSLWFWAGRHLIPIKPPYGLRGIGHPTIARAVAGDGIVVGSYQGRAFVWHRGKMTLLGDPGPTGWSEADAVNDSGVVVGRVSTDAQGSTAPVAWPGNSTTSLGSLGGPDGAAFAINDPGDVVGSSHTAHNARHAFLWRSGSMYDLNAHMTPTPGAVLTTAVAINAAGQIAGTGVFSGKRYAFLLTPISAARRAKWRHGVSHWHHWHRKAIVGVTGAAPVAAGGVPTAH